jgi:glycosyltransferase involved in cell wall biosynthesis
MMCPMKILFTRFPFESAYGGAEIQTLSLMKGLLEKGHAVAFLGSCPVLLEMCRNEGIPAAELKIGPPPVTKAGALTFAWRKRKMRQLLEGALSAFDELDAIVMLGLSEKLLLTPFAAKRGIKALWIEHDRIGSWLTKNPWLPLLLRNAKDATTVAVSELSKKEYVRLGWPQDRTVAIPNGIDEKRLGEGERTERERLHIGCIARLSADKGVGLLLDAVKDLPGIDLSIVGKGPLEAKIWRQAQAINLRRERVSIEPSVASVGDFYRSIDALVLPSKDHDPFGMAPAEAMLCGTPVIVTDACGIAGYLRHGDDAILVKAGSAPALRMALTQIQNDSLRSCLSEQGQKTARRLFSIDRMVEHYLSLLA